MIEIGINPNTNIPSVAIRLNGYFGLGKDGIKLVDSDTVFQPNTVKLLTILPSNAFDTLQTDIEKTGDKPVDSDRDPKTGRFLPNNSGAGGGRPLGSKKEPLSAILKEVLETKHYKIKDTGEMVVANEIIAEKWLDKVVERLDPKLLKMLLERTEGKVTQGVKISGGLQHGVVSEEEMKKYEKLFPSKQ